MGFKVLRGLSGIRVSGVLLRALLVLPFMDTKVQDSWVRAQLLTHLYALCV